MSMTITGELILLFLVMWPIAAAFISYLIGRLTKRGRDYFANGAVLLELGVMVFTAVFMLNAENPITFDWTGFMGARIYLILDGFRAIYGVIACIMWVMTTFFSREYFAHYRNRNRYYLFMLFTLSGTIGVFLSGDLITTFMFFEMMSFTSYVMVIHDEKPGAQEAAKTYMAVAVIGGLSMLMGIFLITTNLHTTEIGKLYDAMHHYEGNMSVIYLAAAFMLVGFGGKAGMYPIHIWLPNAHPAAPAPASALLSGVLTKTGIFGILVMSSIMFAYDMNWGLVILIIGTLGMFTGAMLALFSIDLKRTLACSSVSQIGFILVGVGMQCILGHHDALAVRGTLLHMLNHSLIKLLLFMAAGVVYMNLHKLDLNQIRGFGRKKPLLAFCFLMGVLAIIGMPGWNGYVSKTLLHESIVEQIWLFPDYSFLARFFQVIESIFTFSGGMTAAYMTKIFVCIFIEKNQFDQGAMDKSNKIYMNKTSSVVLFLCAIVMPILGLWPDAIMIPLSKLGQTFMMGEDPAHAVQFYIWQNLKGAVASLAIGVILYVFIIRGCLMKKDEQGRVMYINAWPAFLDIEQKIYRPMICKVLPFMGAMVARIIGMIPAAIASLVYKLIHIEQLRTFIDNSSKEPMFDLTPIRNRMTGQPIIRMDKVHAWFEQAQPAQLEHCAEQIWEGEGSINDMIGDYMEMNRPSAAGHDVHHGDTSIHEEAAHEHFGGVAVEEKTKMSSPSGIYDWMVYGYAVVVKKFGDSPGWASALHRKKTPEQLEQQKLVKTVFNSMAYGILMLALGLAVILVYSLMF